MNLKRIYNLKHNSNIICRARESALRFRAYTHTPARGVNSVPIPQLILLSLSPENLAPSSDLFSNLHSPSTQNFFKDNLQYRFKFKANHIAYFNQCF